jgi:hypothetical protein
VHEECDLHGEEAYVRYDESGASLPRPAPAEVDRAFGMFTPDPAGVLLVGLREPIRVPAWDVRFPS